MLACIIIQVAPLFYRVWSIPGTPECGSHDAPVTPAPSTPEARRTWETDFHLPSTIRPSFYSIFMVPDLATGSFSGTVTIPLDVTAPADHLLINIDGLRVTTTRLSKEDGSKVRLRETFEYSPNNFWVVLPEQALHPGPYILYLEFSGSMTRNIVGFYMTNYTDPASGEAR